MSDALEKIKLIISQQLEINNERVTENAKIIEDLGADSLDVVELLSILEENFDIQIPSEEGDKIRTVRDLVFCIEEKNKQK
jgi:acyl carrier protein